jgi:fructan beta-fructosidase
VMIKRAIFFLVCILAVNKANTQAVYNEQYRPQIHFSPKEHWINDPNGMVYYKGVYHLFFQYYPQATVWGPMHWGHATSKDLIHWQQQPIALYPDTLGYIFSGSAVVDKNNTSGLGKNGKVPLVAIFTSHNPVRQKLHTNDYENQSIAFSLDNGVTWTKYAGNPVLKNPGITDFRDPKVMWYEPQKKWIMTLATKDRVTFFSSPDLKNWKKESEFGATTGAHGGVWECPDLFPLEYRGKKIWVLIVNLNPGGPNKGSATQYFLGNFDGKNFTPNNTETKWIDYGPDEYAGITWSNTGNRKIFLGWMSNWMYANEVPTKKWRNAMTIPRELHLEKVGKEMFVASEPVRELNVLTLKSFDRSNVFVSKSLDVSKLIGKNITIPCRLNLNLNDISDFNVILSNKVGEKLIMGYNKNSNQYFIDRTLAGDSGFNKEFAEKHFAPRISKNDDINISLLIDESSVELFADGGLSVMTSLFFPKKPYDRIEMTTNENVLFKKIEYIELKSIWR